VRSNIRSTKVPKKAGTYGYMCVRNSSIISSFYSENYSGYSSVISSGYSCLIGSDNADTTICQNNSIISSKCSTIKYTVSGSIIASYNSDICGDSRYNFKSVIGTINSFNNASFSSIIGGKSNVIPEGDILSTIIGGNYNCTSENNSVIIGGRYNSSYQFTPSGSFAPYEPSNRKIQIGGNYNRTNFLTIGGENSYGAGFSIMIGGQNNRSSYSANYAYTSPYQENHQGRSNGIIIGGRNNKTTASVNSIIIGGSTNIDINTVNSSIIGGSNNVIRALGCFNYSLYPVVLQNTVSHTFIIGGSNNTFCGSVGTNTTAGIFTYAPYQVKFSGILGGSGNIIVGTSNPYKFNNPGFDAPGLTSSVIVAGNQICSSFNYAMSVEKLLVRGTLKTKTTGGTICTGFSGSVNNPTSITIVNGLITNMS
jgi:hypothetical protein